MSKNQPNQTRSGAVWCRFQIDQSKVELLKWDLGGARASGLASTSPLGELAMAGGRSEVATLEARGSSRTVDLRA